MNLQPLLAFIRSHEAPKGYDQLWGRIARKHYPPKPITQMTVRQILTWQDSIDPLYQSEASGAYQIMEDTLRALTASGKVSPDQLFDVNTQDDLAVHLMRGRGLDAYVAGHMTAEQFANSLAKEWASLPVVTPVRRTANGRSWVVPAGASYYSGDGLNHALTPVAPFLAAVKAIRTTKTPAKPQSQPTARPTGKQVAIGGGIAAILAALAAKWQAVEAWFNGFF